MRKSRLVISSKKNKIYKGFTLAEALITLVIIGVIAALTIPAILVNTEQHEYKSAFKKALSALNQVIEMNIALEGFGPLEIDQTLDSTKATSVDSIYGFFKKRMNVVSSSSSFDWGGDANYAFFTADGMRYEFPSDPSVNSTGWTGRSTDFATSNTKCATPVNLLSDDEEEVQDDAGDTFNRPCLIIVDVNGQRRPNPNTSPNVSEKKYKVPSATARSKILDVFPVLITDKAAFPYGLTAQRALFQHK